MLETEKTENIEDTAGQLDLDEGIIQEEEGQTETPHMIPKPRFDEVYHQVKAYKSYGTPEEIAAKLDRLTAYDNALQEHRRNKVPKEGNESEVERGAIRKQLLEVMPELNQVGGIQRFMDANIKRAQSHVLATAKSMGVNIPNDMQDDVKRYILNRMNEEERMAIVWGDYSSIDEALTQSIEKGLLSKFKVAQTPPPTPKRHSTGGTQLSENGNNAPKTWKEAEDIAWGIIKEK